jgi:hypothetical protein
MLKYTFYNFTEKSFEGFWNGRKYTFKPGVKKEYRRLIAIHFAKHLANKILTEEGKERAVSPKKPEEVPEFMAVFNKALLVEELPDAENLDIETGGQSIDEPSMNVRITKRESIDPYDASKNSNVGPGSTPQIIGDTAQDDGQSDEADEYKMPGEKSKE